MRIIAVLATLLMLSGAAWAQTPLRGLTRSGDDPIGPKVALVIGNSAYKYVPALQNPGNDALLMARTLTSLGFTLIGGKAQLDLTKAAFDDAVQQFGQKARGAGVALFYYSGHGLQVGGTNWLVPVGANPTSVQDLDFQMLSAQLVLRQMEGAGAKLNVVILDACRNNPFGGRGIRGTESGLGQMQAPEGTIISYATQPGNVASDGTGRNSPYTLALADAMQTPGLDVFRMFNRVGLAVKRATGTQLPWVSNSPIEGEFYFAGVPADAPRPPDVTPVAPPPPPQPVGPVAGATFKDCPDCPTLVNIPAGRFVMGVPPGEEEAEGVPQELRGLSEPQTTIVFDHGFAIGRDPVTRGEFEVFARETGRQPGSSCGKITKQINGSYVWGEQAGLNWRSPGFTQTDSHPVVCVSWDDAQAYTVWLSRRTGQSYRLPSEAEWEYAARAGTTGQRWWPGGRADACRYANVRDRTLATAWNAQLDENYFPCSDDFAYTAPIGSFPANPFGVRDALGNVWNWTQDCLNGNLSGIPRNGTARTTGDCSQRVNRGGSWIGGPWSVRAGYRLRNSTGYRVGAFGFRVARTN